jgi:hypothetical protein
MDGPLCRGLHNRIIAPLADVSGSLMTRALVSPSDEARNTG